MITKGRRAYLAVLGQIDAAPTTYNFSMRSVASDRNTDMRAPRTDMTAIIRNARQSGLGIIVCMTNHDQLDQNLRAMSEPFTPEDEELLKIRLSSISPTYCRMCGSCGGICEKGLPVPDILRFLAYAEGYAQFAMARQQFLDLPERVRAVRCDGCETCSVRCPNGVKVRDRMILAQEMFA